jgi:succinoglycan biosynthesis transport protein ExoP
MTEIQDPRKPSLGRSKNAENDLGYWMGVLGRRKAIVSVIVAGALALGVLIWFTLTPLYTANISILLDPKRNAAMDLSHAISGMPIDVGFVESEVAVIGSFNTIRRVVEKLDLGSDPEFGPSPPGLISFEKLFPSSSQDESDTLKLKPAVRVAIDKLQSSILVRRNGLTYVVDVSVTLHNPMKAAKIANAIADAYLVDGLEAHYTAAQRATTWLDERLTSLKTRLEDSERNVASYRLEHGLISIQSGTIEKQQISEINTQLALARAHTAETKGKLEQTQRLSPEGGSMLHNEYDAAVKREKSLVESISKLSTVANKSVEASIKLHELERESESNRQLYEIFLSKFKEAREETTLETSEAHVITPAVRPIKPSYPKLKPILAVAFVLGLCTSVGAAFALESLARGFQTSEQIEAVLGCPTLGFLPIISARELKSRGDDQGVVKYTIEQPFSRFAEGIRSIRTGVALANLDVTPKIIMVGSTVPGEGKSTVAASIAVSAASSDSKVLLIDLDFRARATSRRFNLDSQPGLVDLLSGADPAQENFYRPQGLNITVLPAGKHTTNPMDIISSQKMALLMEALTKQYELIVLDCPPLLAMKDGLRIAKLAGSIVYVVQWNRTARDAVRTALKAFDANLSKLAGVVLNKVDTNKLKTYAYYGHYYGHRYKPYYGRDRKSEHIES